MPCYCIRAGDTENVKLGWAEDVEQRLGDLQCAHYLPLRVIRIFEGRRWVESWLHRQFAAYRGLGEWFTFQPDMLTIQVPDVGPVQDCVESALLARIEQYLADTGSTATAFGRSALADPTFVHELRKGRECRRSTVARALAFIETFLPPTSAPAPTRIHRVRSGNAGPVRVGHWGHRAATITHSQASAE